MGKTWGKDIWEIKSRFQKGITVAEGVKGLLKGKKKYYSRLNELRNELFNFLKIHKEVRKILEIGPGPDATNAKFFYDKGFFWDLVDCSPNTLKLAKEKLNERKINYFEQDMIDLKLPQKYDLIFCLRTFLHVPQHLSLRVMNNFNKHLKKGGYLVIDFHIKGRLTLKKWLWKGVYYLAHKIKTKFSGKDFYVTCGEYTTDELADIFDRAGFDLIQKKYFWVLQKK
jgi:SAM-dependent methyltransferase